MKIVTAIEGNWRMILGFAVGAGFLWAAWLLFPLIRYEVKFERAGMITRYDRLTGRYVRCVASVCRSGEVTEEQADRQAQWEGQQARQRATEQREAIAGKLPRLETILADPDYQALSLKDQAALLQAYQDKRQREGEAQNSGGKR